MRILFSLIAFSFITICRGQETDSVWIRSAYFPALSTDTGLYLPPVNLVDEKGKTRTLSEFRGKILYIDVWTTWCVNCIANFPRSKKLYNRLKYIHLDSSILFLNICTEESKTAWEKLLKKKQPEGINLYATDTSLYKTWKIDAFPHYVIADREGKIMSLNGIDVRDGVVDYILYAATKNIKPATSIWTYFRQSKYYQQHHRYTDDAEGRDYKAWFNSIVEKLIEDSGQRVQ
jgi:hypothetical protein